MRRTVTWLLGAVVVAAAGIGGGVALTADREVALDAGKIGKAAGTSLRLERQVQLAVVSVADTGISIPAADLPHVFERFYRVDKARSREQGGTGLGLSISKSIVTAHGGGIELTSAPGEGTTCVIALPLAGPKDDGRAGAG